MLSFNLVSNLGLVGYSTFFQIWATEQLSQMLQNTVKVCAGYEDQGKIALWRILGEKTFATLHNLVFEFAIWHLDLLQSLAQNVICKTKVFAFIIPA